MSRLLWLNSQLKPIYFSRYSFSASSEYTFRNPKFDLYRRCVSLQMSLLQKNTISSSSSVYSNSLRVKQTLSTKTKNVRLRKKKKNLKTMTEVHKELTKVLDAQVAILANQNLSTVSTRKTYHTNQNSIILTDSFDQNPRFSQPLKMFSSNSKCQHLLPKCEDILWMDTANFVTLADTQTTDVPNRFTTSSSFITTINSATHDVKWNDELSKFNEQFHSEKTKHDFLDYYKTDKLFQDLDENDMDFPNLDMSSVTLPIVSGGNSVIDNYTAETITSDLNSKNIDLETNTPNNNVSDSVLSVEFMSDSQQKVEEPAGTMFQNGDQKIINSEKKDSVNSDILGKKTKINMINVLSDFAEETEIDLHPEPPQLNDGSPFEQLFTENLSELAEDESSHDIVSLRKMSKTKNQKYVMVERNIKPNIVIKNFNVDKKYFIEACCTVGLHKLAHKTIKYNIKYPTSCNGVNIKLTDIEVYNTLIRSWAKQKQVKQIEELLTFLRKDGLVPNYQTYAGYLECHGRFANVDIDVCRSILLNMESENLHITKLFNKTVFKQDESVYVLKAIKAVHPDFEPDLPPAPKLYQGDLLSLLNTKQHKDKVVEQNPFSGVISCEDLKTRSKTQMELEKKGKITVKSIFNKPLPSERTLEMREKLSTVENEWRGTLIKSFGRKIRYYQRKSANQVFNIYPFLKLISPQEYADCVLQEINEVLRTSDTYSPRLSFLHKRLSNKVFQRCQVKEKIRSGETDKISRLYDEYLENYNSDDFPYINHRQCWHELLNKNTAGPTLDFKVNTWPVHVKKSIGRVLYDMILQDIKIDANILKPTEEKNMIPVFYTIFRNYSFKTVEEIKPNPTIMKIYKGSELNDLTFDMSDMPMLVPPVPWSSVNLGGTLLSSNKLIRLPELAHAQEERLHKIGSEQINPVFDSLNSLGACAWIINKPILDLIVGLFNDKGNKDLDIPPPSSEFPALPKYPKNFKCLTQKEKSHYHRERNQIRQIRMEMFGLWCSELYRLSIANKFRDEIFWFPHNIDFRGRTYPTPPYFNHLGSDLARSLLIFAKGKPLGDAGLNWLKIHLVNLTGLKKRCSMTERLEYAEEMMETIQDSADNPLTGKQWWQESDEPWQTLACCMEITNAIRSPDPAQHISHFPVHQDGSCNGLQHYAALGRDQAGAESVNLASFSHPQDVYSDVAEKVEKQRKKDAKEGVEIAQVLDGFVRRKVIKQTVMTTVYGVTRFGARHQILRQLKDIEEFQQHHAWKATHYLTENTFLSLQEMFTATKGIQEWFRRCAKALAVESNQPVEWVTPLGLPIIQPYHKQTQLIQHGVQTTDYFNQHEKPNIRKQMNAFPPNFIHSLDSTHMMLTSLYCLRAGITYVSVHDCYWTHAVDVPIMNQICREQFVGLHNQPILEDLSNYLVKTFLVDRSETCPDTMNQLKQVLTDVPKRGYFDLSKVLESTYFFS